MPAANQLIDIAITYITNNVACNTTLHYANLDAVPNHIWTAGEAQDIAQAAANLFAELLQEQQRITTITVSVPTELSVPRVAHPVTIDGVLVDGQPLDSQIYVACRNYANLAGGGWIRNEFRVAGPPAEVQREGQLSQAYLVAMRNSLAGFNTTPLQTQNTIYEIRTVRRVDPDPPGPPYFYIYLPWWSSYVESVVRVLKSRKV